MRMTIIDGLVMVCDSRSVANRGCSSDSSVSKAMNIAPLYYARLKLIKSVSIDITVQSQASETPWIPGQALLSTRRRSMHKAAALTAAGQTYQTSFASSRSWKFVNPVFRGLDHICCHPELSCVATFHLG